MSTGPVHILLYRTSLHLAQLWISESQRERGGWKEHGPLLLLKDFLFNNVFKAEIYKIVKKLSSGYCYFMEKCIHGKKIVVGKKEKAAKLLIVTF
jgi:hypothetical protein